MDLFGVAPDEEALDLPVSTGDEVIERASRLPFEPSMVVLAQMEAWYSLVGHDQQGQMQMAAQLFGVDSTLAQAIARFMAQDEAHFAFDDRHFATLRGLLVRHAQPVAAGEAQLDGREFSRALYATSALFLDSDGAPSTPTPELHDWIPFLIRGGAYYASPRPLHAIAFAYALWVDLANRPDMRAHPDFCDVSEWLRDRHRLSPAEYLAVGFGVIAGSYILSDEKSFQERGAVPEQFWKDTVLADRAGDIWSVMAADRGWYANQLGDDADLVWERTPFEQRPLLRLDDGALLVMTPQAMWSWMGDGLYFRLLDIAREKGEVPRFTRFYGELVERYIVELVQSAHPSSSLAGSGRVFGEELSGPRRARVKTPDVAVDLGEDLVLMEVVSGRLTHGTRVEGSDELVASDLAKLVDGKLSQLSRRIAQLLSGEIRVADLRREDWRRVWPALVVAEGLTVAEPLWEHISERHAEEFADARVQPVTILDSDELELLMALVAEGTALHDLLAAKTSPEWQALPVRRWVHDEYPEGEKPRRASLVERNWDAAHALFIEELMPDAKRSSAPRNQR